MASSQGAAVPVWRCVHCSFEVPGVSIPLEHCPSCRKAQVEEASKSSPPIQETPPRANIEKARNTAEGEATASPPPVQPGVQPYQGTPQQTPPGYYYGPNTTSSPQQSLNTSFGKGQGAMTNPEHPTMERNVPWTPPGFPGSPEAMQHLISMWNQQHQQGAFASQQFLQGNPQNWQQGGGYGPQQMGPYVPQQQWGGAYGPQQQQGVANDPQQLQGGVYGPQQPQQPQGRAYSPLGQQGGMFSPHQGQQSSASSLPPPLQPTPVNQPATQQPPPTSSDSQFQNQAQPGPAKQPFTQPPPSQATPQPQSLDQGIQQLSQPQPRAINQPYIQPTPGQSAQQHAQPQQGPANQPQSLAQGTQPHPQPAPSAESQARSLPMSQPAVPTPTSVQQGQQPYTIPPQTSQPETTRPQPSQLQTTRPQPSQLQQAQENGVHQAASSSNQGSPQQSGRKQHGRPAQPLGRGKQLQPASQHPLNDTSSKTVVTRASSKASNEKQKTAIDSQSSKGKAGTQHPQKSAPGAQPPPRPAPETQPPPRPAPGTQPPPRPAPGTQPPPKPAPPAPAGGSSSSGKSQTDTWTSYSAAAKAPPGSTHAGANEYGSSRKKDDQNTRKLRSHESMRVPSTEGVLEYSDRERAVTVNFHVILPLEHWLWDEESKICLRFGHEKLGDWEEDVGKFEIHKDVDGKNYWMRCTLYFDPNILCKGKFISYKYAVFSPRRKDANPYEFFHDCPKKHGVVTDRCLIVPSEHCRPRGSHTRFDGMVFPEELPQTIGKRIKNFFFGSSEVRQLSFSEAQEFSLHAFLEEHSRLLRSLDSPSSSKVSNLEKFVNAVFKIYEQLRVRQTCINDKRDQDWIASLLAKAFKDWLVDIVYSLNSVLIESVADNGKRISLVLIVFDLLGKLMGQLHDSEFGFDEINTIFEMLTLRPDLSKSSTFRDLNDVLNFIPQNYRKHIASVLACFINRILPSNHLKSTNWVYVMPLMHALDGKLEKETSSDVIKWRDDRVNLWNLGKPEKLAFLKVIKELQEGDAPFFKLDPLLLPLLVNRCPRDELPKVIPFIPILLSAGIVKELITKGTKVSKLNIPDIKELVPIVESTTFIVPTIQKFDDVQAVFFEAKRIFEEAIKRLTVFGPVNASFLHAVICLLLQTSSKLKEYCTDDLASSTWIAEELDKLWFEVTGLLLNEWIVKYCTPVFGGTDLKASDKDIKMTEEFIGLSCPPNVLADWQAILEDTLKQRVARIPNKQKLNLLDVIEKKNPHAIVMNVFMDEVTRSFETESNTASLQKLFERGRKYRSTIGRVLDKIFKREYPEEAFEVPVERLLTWDMWPIAMKIYKSELMIEGGGEVGSAQSSLSDKCSLLCSLADSSRSQMMKEINDGSVTFRDMELFLEKQNEIEKLCSADDTYKVAEVQVVLKRRKFECSTFRDYKAKLDSFCSKLSLSKLQVTELSDLLKEIKVDHSDCPLKSLCHAEDSLQDIEYFRFKAAHPLQPILSPFHTFYSQYPSELFQQIWKSKIKSVASEKVTLAIKDVVAKVWDPIFKECCQLIDSVKGMTITLAAVNNCFGNLEEKQSHLERLFKATEAFYGRQVESTTWIRKAIERMYMYWSICEQADAAKTVLELKDSLKLEGDFQVIENVAGAFTKSMDKQTLNDINQRLIEMSSFLEHFTKDRKKLESLKSFAACLDIVEWIRKESQDVNDLHKFVTIALHTSVEEGDLSSDRLSHLKVVGSGFGPLIYGLKNDPSFESFQQGCLAVWEAIDEAPNLPKLLRACNDDLEWYKSVKETQASFEVTSFGQMDNIFQYGSYIVGSAKSYIFQHYHDVIQLTLKARDKRLTKTSYSLEELRDLESKLVLITGSKAENRAKVDIFIDTLHSICRIAEVLLTLQQVGNVNYTGWVLQVRCSTDRQLIDQLQAQASDMEDELSQWEEDVTSQRENFYELNYFTTLQLLTLRRELGRLKDPKATATISPEVLILIQSISSQVEPSHVIDSVNQILLESKQEQELEQVSLTEASGPPTEVVNEVEQKKAVMEALPDESDSQTKKAKEIDKQEQAFSEDSLSDELRGYITTISARISCSRQLVCKSFDILGKSLTRIDYQRWCVENEDEDTFKDNEESDEDSSDSESDSEPSDSESTDHDKKEFTYTSESTVKAQSTLPSSQKKKPVPHVIKIERIAKELVDENHPAVIALIKAGYDEKQSIDAIAKYRTLEEAMDHMEDTSSEEDDDEEREPELFPSVMRQFSRENSLPFFEMDWDNDNDLNIYYLKEAEEKYLKLEYLGRVLRSLTHLPSTVQVQRSFPTNVLKEGYPNLLVGPPENILRTVLSLYMVNHDVHPLPTPEEVLLCYPSTTAEEIELFWRRAINDPEYKRIFCLVHAEKLTYQVSDQALSSLSKLSQAHQNYRLVIVCSNEEESMSYFISKLHMYKRAFMAPSGDEDFKEYLISKFSKASKLVQDCASIDCPASIVDYEGSCVRIVKCDRSGMGKSLYVRRLAENLQQKRKLSETTHVTIPLHGPVITPDTVLELFQDHMKNPSCYIYHIDIAPNILWKVDTILFSLLILQCISDSQGRMWRCHPNQLYAVEVTLPNMQKDAIRQSEKRTLNILDLLPSVFCQSPKEVLKRLKSDKETGLFIGILSTGSCFFYSFRQILGFDGSKGV